MIALACLWAASATLFSLLALRRLGRVPPAPASGPLPAVLLLRPAEALSPGERAALATPVTYAGGLEHVVLAPVRPAAAGIRWQRSDPATPNRKVGHLLGALRARSVAERCVLSVDGDVAVDGALVAALARAVAGGAALATAAPRPLDAPGLGPRAVRALLAATHHDFRALDVMRAGASAVCGKAMALGPAALALLPDVADRAGEDLELARRLHAAGERVVLVDTPALVPQTAHAPLAPALARFTRWLQVLRAHRPALWATVPLLLAPTPLLLGAAAATASVPLAAATAALVGARTALARRLSLDVPPLDWLLGEALLLVAFARSAAARSLRWRGRTFRVARGGRLRPEAA